jgi:hypothetical protein
MIKWLIKRWLKRLARELLGTGKLNMKYGIMLSVIIPNVIVPNVIIPNVNMQSVVAPQI